MLHKGFCKFLFENYPSGFSPHLEDVGSSCHGIVDAVDGEDNIGQGIDCKTRNVGLLERERERGWPWRSLLCVETGIDPVA